MFRFASSVLLLIGLVAASGCTQTFKKTHALAEQGDAEAQFNLGMMYDEGDGVTQDFIQAIKWHTKAAEQGHVDAPLHIGFIYSGRQDFPQDRVKAREWYIKASQAGNTRAEHILGLMLLHIGDNAEGREWIRKSAENGYDYAQNNLANYYLYGQFGFTQDIAKAFAWHTKASEQGNAFSQLALAQMYHDGKGTAPDNIKAYMWFDIAASLKTREASEARGEIAKLRNALAALLTPQQLATAKDLAAACFASSYKNCS